MTINARALGIIVQNDTQVQQTVRLFQGVTPIRDITASYPLGADQATAAANLASVVKSMLQRAASDSTLVACAPGTVLDLSTPAQPAPVQADVDKANWVVAYQKVQRLQRGLAAGVSAVTAQNVSDAQTALNALPYLAAYEAIL